VLGKRPVGGELSVEGPAGFQLDLKVLGVPVVEPGDEPGALAHVGGSDPLAE
jgi:hypothetical protein